MPIASSRRRYCGIVPRPAKIASVLALSAGALGAQTAAPPVARVVGMGFDSIAMRPLTGARVRAVDARDPVRARVTTTDSAGRFVLDSLEAGRWLATLLHPTLDSLGLEPPLAELEVRESGDVSLLLATPSARTLIVNRCGLLAVDLGILYGVLRSASDDTPLAQATLTVEWPEWVIRDKKRGLVAESRRLEVRSDSAGRFAMCGVPAATTVRLQMASGSDSSGALGVEIPTSGISRRDFTLGSASWAFEVQADSGAGRAADTVRVRRGNASTRGRVADINGRPIVGGTVRVLGSGRQGRTSDDGSYTVLEAAPGTQTIEARAIGFQPVRQTVELRDGITTPVSFTLAPQTVQLDTVRVMAGRKVDPAVGAFERRWRSGVGGTFMDGETVRQRSVVFVSDALRAINGVRVVPVGGYGQRILMRGMAGRECVPLIFVDGIPMHTLGGGLAEMFLDDFVSSSEVAAMEVFPRSAMIPAQYMDSSGCGALAVWTRQRFGGVEPRDPRQRPQAGRGSAKGSSPRQNP